MNYASPNPLEAEWDYTYEARNNACRYNRGAAAVGDSGNKWVQSNNHEALINAVNESPVSVLIEAD